MFNKCFKCSPDKREVGDPSEVDRNGGDFDEEAGKEQHRHDGSGAQEHRFLGRRKCEAN